MTTLSKEDVADLAEKAGCDVSAREIAEAVGVSIDAVHAYLPNLEGKRMVKKCGKRPAPKTMPVQLWIWIGE